MNLPECHCHESIPVVDELHPQRAWAAIRQDVMASDVRRHVLRDAGVGWDQVFLDLRAAHPPAGPNDLALVRPIPTGETFAVSRHVGEWVRRTPRP